MQSEPLLTIFYEALAQKPTDKKQPGVGFNAIVSFCCMYLRCIKADQHTSPKLIFVAEQLFEQVRHYQTPPDKFILFLPA